MDPLSMSLAVIAFATAVKDMIELGQKIHESFTKASRNYQKAQSVAEDIKEMVDQIEQFCENHTGELDDMKDFRDAVLGLLAKLRDFEASVLPLLPQAGGRRRDRIVRAWEAWRNNNKTEESIVNLQSDIKKVMRKYIWKSAMRVEGELGKFRQETSRGLTSISQGLQAVREDVSVILVTTAANSTVHSSYESSASGSSEFDRHIIMFAQSTSSASEPMLRTPDMITEELATAAYINLQIKIIVARLDEISKLTIPISNDVNNFHMYPSMEISMKITDLQHFVVRQVLDIRDLLDAGRIQAISIQEGARLLNKLSLGLKALHMGTESIQVSKWTIKLAHAALVDCGAEHPDLRAALSVYLTNQSVQYHENGDRIQSLQSIEDAHTIALELRNQFDGEVPFQILYSHVLLHYSLLVDTQRSIEMLTEAVQVLEGILNIQEPTQSQTPDTLKKILKSSASFLDHLFSSPLPVIAISDYAHALQRLGTCLFAAGRYETAVDLQLLAIAVCRKMAAIHGNEHRTTLANALSSLVRNKIARGYIPVKLLISLIEDCIQLFRDLVGYNPTYYIRFLIDALWAKATALESLERDAEAIEALEEVVRLAEQMVGDSTATFIALDRLSNWFRRLNRHSDAVQANTKAIAVYRLSPEHQAVRYGILSKDLGELLRYKESAEESRKSVSQHRRMAMKDPGTKVAGLVFMLSELAHRLAASGDYSEALISWRESLDRVDNFLLTNPDASSTASSDYLLALRTHISVSYIIEDEKESLRVSSTTTECLRRFSEIYRPQDLHVTEMLIWAEFIYAYNFLRLGRLEDARRYVEDWVGRWSGNLEATSDPDIMRWHATMIGLKSNILDAQGSTEEALLANQKIGDIVRPSVSDHHPCFVEMIKSMVRSAQLQMDLGNNDSEALKVAEEALQLARDDKLGPTIPTPVRSLHGVASTALFCQDYERAREIALEGCKICASSSWQEVEFTILFRPSLLALLSSAEANLGRYSDAVVYAKKAVEVSLDIKDIKLYISATTAKQSYMETRGNLAEILLVTGDLVQARQICEERRTYFSERIEARRGEHRDLAPVLRMLGILFCSEGRHDEGNNAAQELLQMMERLRCAFPSLHKQVKIRLRHQAQVPILKVLDDMYQTLDCEHQTGVASLFAA